MIRSASISLPLSLARAFSSKDDPMSASDRRLRVLPVLAVLGAICVAMPALADTVMLQAAGGITALAGQVLSTDGKPITNVKLIDQGAKARTDEQGRFLLDYAPSGDTVLTIDGRRSGPKGQEDRGVYKVRVTVHPGITNLLPFTSYLPLVDHAGEVSFPSPTTTEVVIKSRSVPGVELRIPAGTIVRDSEGKLVTKLGVTGYPAGRTPFPLPPHFDEAANFTIQPGALCFLAADGTAGSAQVRYPNTRHELPRARATFFRYDVAQLGWTPYGIGTVGADGKQVVPDGATVLHDLDGECPPKPPHDDMMRQRQPRPAKGGN